MNVADTLIGASFLGMSAWALISAFSLWTDNWRMNQQIKDGKGLHPNEVRNLSSLGGQLVLINVINVIAGATAGIGASLFVDGAQLRWPPTELAVWTNRDRSRRHRDNWHICHSLYHETYSCLDN